MDENQLLLLSSDPVQDELARLRRELEYIRSEKALLLAEKQHWQMVASVLGPQWHGGYGEFDSHAVREDGIYIHSFIEGQRITVFVDRETAFLNGWLED